MSADYVALAASLEAEVESLFATLAAERARTAELMGEVKAIDAELDASWDRYERAYAWAFGGRGVYPEIPKRWYSVVFRLVERLDTALTEDQKRGFAFTQIKEKHGGIRIYYNADGGADRDVIEPLVEQAEAEVERIERLCRRLR